MSATVHSVESQFTGMTNFSTFFYASGSRQGVSWLLGDTWQRLEMFWVCCHQWGGGGVYWHQWGERPGTLVGVLQCAEQLLPQRILQPPCQ